MFLPIKKKKGNGRCPHCCLYLKDGPASLKIKPEIRPHSKFANKLRKKLENNVNLTRYQEKYRKKIRPSGHNSLVRKQSLILHGNNQ